MVNLLTKQRDMVSMCAMFTMQIIRSCNMSNLLLLNLVHTYKVKLYWQDIQILPYHYYRDNLNKVTPTHKKKKKSERKEQ